MIKDKNLKEIRETYAGQIKEQDWPEIPRIYEEYIFVKKCVNSFISHHFR